MIEWREENEQGEHFEEKDMFTRKIGIESTGEENGMKNVKRDENSPVETIDERLKRLHTNEIDARNRLRLREDKGVGRAGKQRQLGRGNRRIS